MKKIVAVSRNEAVSSRSLGEEVVSSASKWIGKGFYSEEPAGFVGFDLLDGSRISDFKVAYCNHENTPSYIVRDSKKRLLEGTGTLNCWQFVLLCLMDSKVLTELDVKQIYRAVEQKNKGKTYQDRQTRVPDILKFQMNYNLDDSRSAGVQPQKGDIVLFKRKRDDVDWHCAIYHSRDMDNISVYEILEAQVDLSTNKLSSDEEVTFVKAEDIQANVKQYLRQSELTKPKDGKQVDHNELVQTWEKRVSREIFQSEKANWLETLSSQDTEQLTLSCKSNTDYKDLHYALEQGWIKNTDYPDRLLDKYFKKQIFPIVLQKHLDLLKCP